MSTRHPSTAAGYRLTQQPFVQVNHWIVHHPRFTKNPTALVVYMRLRSAFYAGDQTLRAMTTEQIAEMCGLQERAARKARTVLQEMGVLRRTNPEKKNAVPVFEFIDTPPEGYDGITNGLALRDAILNGSTREEFESKADISGGTTGAPPSKGISRKVRKKDIQGGTTGAPGGTTGAPGAPTVPPHGSVSAGHSAAPGCQEPSKQEALLQEPARTRAATPEASRKEEVASLETDERAEAVIDGVPWGVHTPGGRERQRVAGAVSRALAAGWSPEALTARLKASLGPGVASPVAVVLAKLKDLPAAPTARPGGLPEWCGGCGDTIAFQSGYHPSTHAGLRMIGEEYTTRCPQCHPAVARLAA